MPINAHPDYIAAEKEYHLAQTLEEKLEKLKKMISTAPGHKGAENLRQQLTTRRKKLESQIAKAKKSGKSSKKGIKKSDMQAVILGLGNSGKSSLLSILTNASPKISEIRFTTTSPIIGMMSYLGTQIQLIENPSLDSEYNDKGLINSADTLLLLITKLDELKKIHPFLIKSQAKKIIVFNSIDNKDDERKISSFLQSKKHNFVFVNLKTKENIEELKEKIFSSFDNIRVFTKEPGKPKSPRPVILKPNATVKDVAEKILHGFSKTIKETKIWGPSSKFAGQKVGLKHKLKDLDIIEFKTK
ncbi:MAG: GTPase [archaeon]